MDLSEIKFLDSVSSPFITAIPSELNKENLTGTWILFFGSSIT
jgi:hypothetical protein